jgi:hypothetical protein
MLPFLLVVLSSLCTLTHAASIPSHVSFLKGGQSDEEICVCEYSCFILLSLTCRSMLADSKSHDSRSDSNCPDQPAFNGPAIHKATSPVEANGDQMSADYGPFVICTYVVLPPLICRFRYVRRSRRLSVHYFSFLANLISSTASYEDNTRVSYDAYGYIYSLTTDRQPTETQPDRLEGFDRSRFIDQTCTPPPPPSPPLATDNNADEQSSPVTVPSADGPPPSTDTPPQPPSSTTAPACESESFSLFPLNSSFKPSFFFFPPSSLPIVAYRPLGFCLPPLPSLFLPASQLTYNTIAFTLSLFLVTDVCPPENEYEKPLSSTVQGESDFTCWLVPRPFPFSSPLISIPLSRIQETWVPFLVPTVSLGCFPPL